MNDDQQKFMRTLFCLAIITLAILILWPVMMVLSQLSGTMDERLAKLAADSTPYRLNFIVASLIAPPLVLVMIMLSRFHGTKKQTPLLNHFGMIMLAPYMILVTIAYSAQYTMVPAALAAGDVQTARQWFFENPQGFSYFFNQLGYTFFALSALAIGWRYLFESGLLKGIGFLLLGSGILSFIAFAGLALQNETINSVTFISGLLMLPFCVLVMLWARKELKPIP